MHISRRWKISVNGTVQGVGFRPFVYNCASELGLTGFVTNTPDGVLIEAQGGEAALGTLVKKIKTKHPPLARVHEVSFDDIELKNSSTFEIIKSQNSGSITTQISPDIAPCEDCLKEMRNESDRRASYPFINCTNCGPRYTIIKELPYDRPKTTMRDFELCEKCRAEYLDPKDRRFHAQPIACDECGPKLDLVSCHPDESRDPVLETIKLLDEGKIVAIKGIGGFHLACDAASDEAVKEMRKRKRRDEKPFAVMVGDIETAKKLCHISKLEEELLTSPQKPIVLLRRLDPRFKHAGMTIPLGDDKLYISDLVAPNNKNLGLMLPSSPLHFLLFDPHESRVTSHEPRLLVMTSANISDEPLAYKNDEAMERLKNIADHFLTHDRDIHIRIDDSIVRELGGAPLVIRRARGYTPESIRLKFKLPEILATGADLKGTVCLTKGHNVYLSQHLGDLENCEAFRSFEQTIEHLQNIFDVKPEIIAHDTHPDYFSTGYATGLKQKKVAVQHHHAHIASCMAENDLPNEKVIGIALDGAGMGTDGAIWGGEVLVADYSSFERAAHFAYVPMPGGDIAAKETWRMAMAYLRSIDPPLPSPLPQGERELVFQMLKKNINCPLTSSCGRLFDAVASLTGLCNYNSFEGQAAQMLEQAADENEMGRYNYEVQTADYRLQTLKLDYKKMIEEILNDVQNNIPISNISAKFHNTLVDSLTSICGMVRSAVCGLQSAVCLSGGSFQNAFLTTRLKNNLEKAGFRVYTHHLVPPNDGGIALGQAVVAGTCHPRTV